MDIIPLRAREDNNELKQVFFLGFFIPRVLYLNSDRMERFSCDQVDCSTSAAGGISALSTHSLCGLLGFQPAG